jgi:hypothetical protein
MICIVGSDTEEINQDSQRINRSESMEEDENDQDYEAQADDIFEKVWRMFKDEDSWSQEAKSTDGFDIVFSKTYPKWGKVFRLSVSKELSNILKS